MLFSKRLQALVLFSGDWALFYLGLYLALALRYQISIPPKIWHLHQLPFFIIYLVWVLIFYVNGLYDPKNFSSLKSSFTFLVRTMLISGLTAILVFYLVPAFKITPKTNLLIASGIITILLFLWRRFFWNLACKVSKIKMLFLGYSKEALELAAALKTHPHLGYEPMAIMVSQDELANFSPLNKIESSIIIPLNHNLSEIIKKYRLQFIVASREIIHDKNAAKRLYEIIPLGISITDLPSFYEEIMEKVPVSIITEVWFLENLFEINKRAFRFFKRIFDVIFSIVLGVITLVLILPIFGPLVKIEDRGPIFLRQKRVGKNGKIFELIKFRSMKVLSPDGSAEPEGARWAQEKDERITKIGRFIRKTRIDELPQFWNILKGELSFIGPRPERPEFVKELEKEIPHYAMRHLVKPGLSGWAQIKLPHGGVGEESMEKLQYDLYYIKNRSFTLDLAIVLKTLATLLKFEGR